jgi:hypothetical protein
MDHAWVTDALKEILEKYADSYNGAISEASRDKVLKIVKGKLKELGRKGLPKELGRVWQSVFGCLFLYQLIVVAGH